MTPDPRRTRDELAARLVELRPKLSQRFSLALPPELRERIGAVTIHQLEAIRLISEHGSVTISELATQLSAQSMSTATQMADRLEKLDLVARVHDTNDRRIVRLNLTEHGQSLVRDFKAARQHTFDDLLAQLTDEELETFIRLLERIAGA
jgi:DNA-binding MarR family transcriptional regulator